MGARAGESRLEELKRYVAFGDVESRLVAALRPIAQPHFGRIARSFYDRIREHEEAHAVFTGEAQIERLQQSLRRWLDRLLSGRYDEAYLQDDGPGLASADDPIFDPFFSTKPDGTGLGLAITPRIVDDHRGEVAVEGRPGRTVFRVQLPLDLE